MEKDVENLAKILAVLVAEGNYTYVDKIGNAPSKDLLAFYLKETFRDFHSLMRSGAKEDGAKKLLDKIRKELKDVKDPFDYLNSSVSEVIKKCDDRKKLREISSLISAKALAISSKYVKVKQEEGGV